MTIRLRCAECRRKLKVVDEALGKKVQCPACGARFIGKIEPTSPPAVKSQPDRPLAAVPLAAPVAPPPPETPADDDIFSELSAFSTPSAEEAPPVQETPEAKPDGALFPNLELDHSPAEVRDAEVEAVEPEVIDESVEPLPVEDETGLEEIEEVVADEALPELPEEEVIEEAFEEEPWATPPAEKGKKPSRSAIEDEGVEPLMMEEEPIGDLTEAVEEMDAVDVREEAEEGIEPEIVDEGESAEETKPRSKKKKSRGMLYVWLAIAFVLLLGCASGGYALYLYVNGQL
ncbi:MAG TPA: hypothetical protein VMG10_18845 [Gemmataceae bacterium]|nr:hypothetical protein [Gemmataceae bacterium]